ncbi:MAG: hypothetical protein QOH49_4081 [Acidobacteriota bacterium]|jgi:hypothetical protein|nr:hypothetical protein [Acidobacteriota bacterium]
MARERKEVSKRSDPSCRSRNFLRLCLLPLAASFVFTACAETAQQQSARDGSPTPQPPQTAAAPPTQAAPGANPSAAPAPPLADVQGALARIYHDTVALQASRGTPFVVGDFNGDDSQDIAMVVTPAKGKLPKINSEYASWLVGDPRKVVLPEVRGDVKVFPKRPEPVVVRPDDLLLVVIHGYQQAGWRNPLSAQTFLLRNAVGDEMKTRSAENVLNAATDKGRLPQLRGDVIWETLAGETGFIYWTGTKYAWAGPAGHGQGPAP